MLSRTKIKERARKKTSPALEKILSELLKNEAWQEVARILSGPTRNQVSVNLDEIDKKTEIGDTVLIPGKVLSKGDLTKKVRIVTLFISESAKEKAKSSKAEIVTITEEIKKNPKFEGVKIIN